MIVHRRQLLDQWVAALGHFLGLAPQEIGQIGGGKHKPTGRLDMAMIQSLSQDGVVDDISRTCMPCWSRTVIAIR